MYAIEKLNEGFQNEIYKIKSQKGEYCLRISKRNSPKHVQYEIDILRCLTDLPVINLQSVNGEYIFSVSGKTAILYSYIDGEIKHNNTDEELRIAGAFLADFHNSCHDIGYLETRFEYYNLSEQIIEEHKNIINDSLIPYREFLPEIIAGLSLNILSKKLPSGPIHVDLGPKNVLWKDGELAAVLDFDNAYNGPRVLDI